MSTVITIFFLRHGRSSGDDEGVHEGRYDTALTETGRSQAQTRARIWKERGITFDLIISSTIQRATRAVELVVRRGAGRYLVVTHGGILNAALRHILSAPPPLHEHGVWFEIADTGYVQTSYDPNYHPWTVHAFDPGKMSDE